MTAPFEVALVEIERRLGSAFIARYGQAVAPDLTAEVVAWAWEHQDRLVGIDNMAGYLFRVGQSKARRLLRWRRDAVDLPAEPAATDGQRAFEPALHDALIDLDPDQRVAVVLVHCFGWTQPEVAELLDVELHTVRNRVHRGMRALRSTLGAET